MALEQCTTCRSYRRCNAASLHSMLAGWEVCCTGPALLYAAGAGECGGSRRASRSRANRLEAAGAGGSPDGGSGAETWECAHSVVNGEYRMCADLPLSPAGHGARACVRAREKLPWDPRAVACASRVCSLADLPQPDCLLVECSPSFSRLEPSLLLDAYRRR